MLFCETVTRETEYCQFACFWHFVLLAQQHCFVNLMHKSFETPAPPLLGDTGDIHFLVVWNLVKSPVPRAIIYGEQLQPRVPQLNTFTKV